jgi:hypothetical protein
MDMKTQFEKHPSPIKFEKIGNEWYTSIRYKVGKAKDVFNNPNDIEFQTLKKCINESDGNYWRLGKTYRSGKRLYGITDIKIQQNWGQTKGQAVV